MNPEGNCPACSYPGRNYPEQATALDAANHATSRYVVTERRNLRVGGGRPRANRHQSRRTAAAAKAAAPRLFLVEGKVRVREKLVPHKRVGDGVRLDPASSRIRFLSAVDTLHVVAV